MKDQPRLSVSPPCSSKSRWNCLPAVPGTMSVCWNLIFTSMVRGAGIANDYLRMDWRRKESRQVAPRWILMRLNTAAPSPERPLPLRRAEGETDSPRSASYQQRKLGHTHNRKPIPHMRESLNFPDGRALEHKPNGTRCDCEIICCAHASGTVATMRA